MSHYFAQYSWPTFLVKGPNHRATWIIYLCKPSGEAAILPFILCSGSHEWLIPGPSWQQVPPFLLAVPRLFAGWCSGGLCSDDFSVFSSPGGSLLPDFTTSLPNLKPSPQHYSVVQEGSLALSHLLYAGQVGVQQFQLSAGRCSARAPQGGFQPQGLLTSVHTSFGVSGLFPCISAFLASLRCG